MDKTITKSTINDIVDGNIIAVERFRNNIYRLSSEALYNNKSDMIIGLFRELIDNSERIDNKLEINVEKNSRIYNYGMICGMIRLVLEITDFKEEEETALRLFKKYKLLFPIMTYINTYRKVSGQELKQRLDFNSDSNLSNFISRIKKHNLLYVQKMGTTNYYSLTPKGKKVLLTFNINQKLEDDVPSISENVLIELLNEISNQIESEKLSTFNTLKVLSKNKTRIKNKSIVKFKINTIYSSCDKYIKARVKSSIMENKPQKKIDNFNRNYSLDSYYDFIGNEIEITDYKLVRGDAVYV